MIFDCHWTKSVSFQNPDSSSVHKGQVVIHIYSPRNVTLGWCQKKYNYELWIFNFLKIFFIKWIYFFDYFPFRLEKVHKSRFWIKQMDHPVRFRVNLEKKISFFLFFLILLFTAGADRTWEKTQRRGRREENISTGG